MSNTYTQIHIQVVFAVQNRNSLISDRWREELYKYIAGIIRNHEHKLLAINGMPDHVHLFFGMRPSQSLSELMKDVKGDSSRWINKNGLVKGRFEWQEGYAGFSYNKDRVHSVISYIRNQQEYHKQQTFIEEYKGFLKEFHVEYDERYIFKAIDY